MSSQPAPHKKPIPQPIARSTEVRALVAKTAARGTLPTAAFFAAALVMATSLGCHRNEDVHADVSVSARKPAHKSAVVTPLTQPDTVTAPATAVAEPAPTMAKMGGSFEVDPIAIPQTAAVVAPKPKPVTKSKTAVITPTPRPMPMGGDIAPVYPAPIY